MNSLCWNCRRLRSPRLVLALHDMVRRWDPKIVFPLETKLRKRRMERVGDRLGFTNGLFVPSKGHSGGLTLLWTKEINPNIKSFSNHHIDTTVTEANSSLEWRITGFYGHPQTHLCHESWNIIILLGNQMQLPWFCFGDFNKIVSMEEKWGGEIRPQSQMEGFCNVINLCEFKDLGISGPDYTWCNMQEGGGRIFLRLGRALATCDWIEKFGEVRVHHLVYSTSNHYALFISDPLAIKRSWSRHFHFEAIWTKRNECRGIIDSVWGSISDMNTPEGMANGLKLCAS